ncbi:MAG: hypothetical protein HYR66_14715 [Sphingobacteriales bacterium]|nr:hypothetical protein [Sphingobacteriales bacterium]MBI3720647.1 hypothetical protein [Sphingobacteriales bacterium]
MQAITDKTNNHVAYLHSNMIISLHDEVIGVMLGNCLFSNGKTIGKVIKDKLHHSNGKIIGLVGKEDKKKNVDEVVFHTKAWNIISSIKNHACNWIEEENEWDNQSFLQHFN